MNDYEEGMVRPNGYHGVMTEHAAPPAPAADATPGTVWSMTLREWAESGVEAKPFPYVLRAIAEYIDRNDAIIAAQAQEIARLRECVEDCCTRMERARGILSGKGNWAMLDTQSARAALKEPSK